MAFIKDLYRFFHPKWQNAFLDYKVKLEPRYSKEKTYKSNPFLDELFLKNETSYRDLLKSLLQFEKEILSISTTPKDEYEPQWNNGFLPGLDIILLYSIIKLKKPAVYLEIGSGHSTKVAHKAIKSADLDTRIISIDPYPRSEIDHISSQILRKPVETLDHDDPIFQILKEGDILFIDSSHRVLPNSDCAFIYNELIPSLPKGVIIHIHDIYLPYDYPQFMCDRLYNENQMLAAYLLSNPDYFDILFPNFYVYKSSSMMDILDPIFETQKMKDVERHGGSIWLVKK